MMYSVMQCLFQGGNFSHSCTDIRLWQDDGPHLQATCGSPPNTSQLYLNEKIINDKGVLRCKQCWGTLHIVTANCEFSHSCRDITLKGTVLSASCGDDNGHSVTSSVDLDDCVMNNHSELDWVC